MGGDGGGLRKIEVSTCRVKTIQCPISVICAICTDPSLPDSLFLFDRLSIYHFNAKTNACAVMTDHGLLYSSNTRPICSSDGQAVWFAADDEPAFRRLDVPSKSVVTGFRPLKNEQGGVRQLAWNRGPFIRPDSELLVLRGRPDKFYLWRYDIRLNMMNIILSNDFASITCTETGHIITVSADSGIVQAYDPRTREFALLFTCEGIRPAISVIDHKRWLVGVTRSEVWRTALSPEYFHIPPCCERDR